MKKQVKLFVLLAFFISVGFTSPNSAIAGFRVVGDDHDKCATDELPFFFDGSTFQNSSTTTVVAPSSIPFPVDKCIQSFVARAKKEVASFCKSQGYKKYYIVEASYRGQTYKNNDSEIGCFTGGLGCCNKKKK